MNPDQLSGFLTVRRPDASDIVEKQRFVDFFRINTLY